jgi:hypothetical protein
MAPMEAVRFSAEEHGDLWRQLLRRAHNATLFHDLDFLSYHPGGRFDVSSLLFFSGGRLVSALPAALREEAGQRALVSPYGASWGGLLLPAGLGAREVYEIVQSMIRFAGRLGVERIDITLPPIVYLDRQDQVQEYALLASGFRLEKAETTEVVELGRFHDSALSSPYRRGVRKAGREGVAVDRSGDLDTFHRLLVEDRAAKDVVPTHSLEDLHRIRERCRERVHLFLAAAGGRAVGGALLFGAGRHVVLNMYLCQKQEARELRAANLLMYHTAAWARDEGYSFLDMGTSSIDMEPNWGLTRFKEGFLGRGYLRPSFSLRIGDRRPRTSRAGKNRQGEA